MVITAYPMRLELVLVLAAFKTFQNKGRSVLIEFPKELLSEGFFKVVVLKPVLRWSTIFLYPYVL